MKSIDKEMNLQSSVSKSVYAFFAISMGTGFVSAIVGSLLTVNLLKTPGVDETPNAAYFFPLLINGVGVISGLIAKEKATNNEVSPADGCAIGLSVYFNLIIVILYVFFLLGIGYLLAQAWA